MWRGTASETVKSVVKLHAEMLVGMKGTTCHPAMSGLHAIKNSCLLGRDSRFDCCKQIHLHSFPGIKIVSLYTLYHRCQYIKMDKSLHFPYRVFSRRRSFLKIQF